MKVALVGASGFVGKAVLGELLQRNHQVTAIVLTQEEIAPQKGLDLIVGNVEDTDSFSNSVSGHDAVISAFNAGWKNPHLYQDFLKGSRSIQEGVIRSGVQRLLVSGGAGSLFLQGKQLVDLPEFPEQWKAGATAARDYLNELQQEEKLDWVFVSPAIEMHPGTSGHRKGTYRLGGDEPVFDQDGNSVISVEDLAVAIVDELEEPKYNKERFTVAY
ncbi:NAD(P)-dependent oxidoreductase [Pedobacter jeongneungensis]|uniref:NAD(P)-dependent oxidoreductase n=1 Tax=Pedobacter jeongneungensis TaxID=947309 RepID=A0ABP8B7W9_9SPHI